MGAKKRELKNDPWEVRREKQVSWELKRQNQSMIVILKWEIKRERTKE